MIRRAAAHVATLATIVVITAIAMPGRSVADVAARSALRFAPGSELWMEGKSTVHDWESRTKTINVVFTRAAGHADPSATAAIEALVRSKGVRSVDVRIPVSTLHSERKGLDKNLLKSLDADKYPTIHFRMDRYTVVSPATADSLKLRVEGALTVRGIEKPITLDARALKGDKGVWLEGAEPLDMSDFGIKPPTMMLGTLKVKDRIVIHYRLLLAPDTAVAGVRKSTER
jgi:polyisoprenoid-binding protein YceI